jgi:hypothetical protein
MMRVEHEYKRGGALAYLAAYDVHHARVIGRMEPRTGIEPPTDSPSTATSSKPAPPATASPTPAPGRAPHEQDSTSGARSNRHPGAKCG